MGERLLFFAFITACILSTHCSVVQFGVFDEAGKTGQVTVPDIFGDHMVLQQKKPIPVWGTAEPGCRVTVRLDYQKQITHANDDGTWFLEMPAMKPGGPYEMVIFGKNVIRFSDVYIGDVWICSGQSNMEWPVSQSNDAEQEIESAHFSRIRFLQIEHNVSSRPLNDIVTQGWQICSPKTVSNFSAVAYFFGRDIHQRIEIPIGLIQAAWGGTVAEAWISKAGLVPFSEFAEDVESMEDSTKIPFSYLEQQQLYQQAQQDWIETIKALDQGLSDGQPKWADPHLMADDWQTAKLPGLWEESGIGNYDGIIWYRKAVDIPDSVNTYHWDLSLGPIDDIDQTWVNGVRVGGMDIYNQNREYKLPEGTIQPGINIIVVRVIDHHGGGGFWGSDDQMALISEHGDRFTLSGEWLYKIGVPEDRLPPVPREMTGQENLPTVLFNAMVHPVIPFGMRGVIWYQGESNTDRAFQYRTLFPTLIKDWRSHWKQDFPFLYVQLANYLARNQEPVNSEWAELREAQLMALSCQSTGMAVTIDIGVAEDIHPRNKQDVGKRLALIALAKAYDLDVVDSGPVYRSMRREGRRIRILFDHVNGGLTAKSGGPLKGFAIAGADQKFEWADAVIEGDEVVVSTPSVENPVAVRYAWADNPECNLYNKAGLPASPFRTDDWPGLTWPENVLK
ncbi:9-O-acetylesterase [bacterium]|nr:9-O-acetylesterase [bacterium]